jgi:hypothetical protein
MDKSYTAALSRSQGREGWSVIFRHPVRKDRTTGKPGLRVRRGLRTRDRAEAERLIDEMNELLGEPALWESSARPTAEHRFDDRIVEIFYHDLFPEPADFFSIRDSIIPLPPPDGDYRRVLFAGTTGAGKTTVIRQFLGTDPEHERFPSTSTGKTTIADMEVIIDQGPFRAVVTFMPRDQVRDYVEECMSAAALAAYRGESEAEVSRRLLNHPSQRFRMSYILGQGPFTLVDDDADYEDEDELFDTKADEFIDLSETNDLMRKAVTGLKEIAKQYATELAAELGAQPGDERVLEEIFEENLDHLLRDDEDFQELADNLMEQIEQRFELLEVGERQKTKQSWPRLWSWESHERERFLKVVSRFSSNHAHYFGSLLSPLVNGIRVAGPFKPEWAEEQPKLVLLDGEGLGHTPDSSASIPTAMTRRFDDVDVVLLVDNAAQPMQAAPITLMRSLAASGRTSKLLTCFTHMDLVLGDNLPTFNLKKQHVLASAENALTSIGEQLGRFAERALRRSLQRGCFFVGGIERQIGTKTGAGRRTIDQFIAMRTAIGAIREVPAVVGSYPMYDRINLVLAVKNAAEKFHEDWEVKLGQRSKPGVSKEHWTRVKALTRRFAEGWADEYGTLRPVADLHRNLQTDIYVFIQNAIWDGPQPDDEEKQQIFDSLAEAISKRILELAVRRIREQQVEHWQDAYNKSGPGSTFHRAAIIRGEIYQHAAPVPDVAPSLDRNEFLHEAIELVRQAADEVGIKLK